MSTSELPDASIELTEEERALAEPLIVIAAVRHLAANRGFDPARDEEVTRRLVQYLVEAVCGELGLYAAWQFCMDAAEVLNTHAGLFAEVAAEARARP